MSWSAPVPSDLYLPIGIILSLIGIFIFLWLIFYVENSRDLPPRDRILGILFRSILMSLFLGFGIFFLSNINLI